MTVPASVLRLARRYDLARQRLNNLAPTGVSGAQPVPSSDAHVRDTINLTADGRAFNPEPPSGQKAKGVGSHREMADSAAVPVRTLDADRRADRLLEYGRGELDEDDDA